MTATGDGFEFAVPTFEHINTYRERMGLAPYPTKPVQVDSRIRCAFELIAKADSVTLLTPEEVLDIIGRAINGEFE